MHFIFIFVFSDGCRFIISLLYTSPFKNATMTSGFHLHFYFRTLNFFFNQILPKFRSMQAHTSLLNGTAGLVNANCPVSAGISNSEFIC